MSYVQEVLDVLLNVSETLSLTGVSTLLLVSVQESTQEGGQTHKFLLRTVCHDGSKVDLLRRTDGSVQKYVFPAALFPSKIS